MKLFTTLFLSTVAASSILSAAPFTTSESANPVNVMSYSSTGRTEKATLQYVLDGDCQPDETFTATPMVVSSTPDCWHIWTPTKCDPSSATPEPASVLLLGSGLLAARFLRKRSKAVKS